MQKGISYSSISTAYTCYQKYKYLYVDELSTPGPDSAELHFGTAIHMGLQAMIEGADYQSVFSFYWQSIKKADVEYRRYDWDAYLEMGTVFLARFERLHLKSFGKPDFLEERLYKKLGKFDLEGTPDYIGEYKGVLSVIDFKTSATPYPKEKIVVNEQMPLYAYLSGLDVKQAVYYVFCKSDTRIQTVVQELTPEFMKNKLANIESMCEDLSQRSTYPRNTNGCMMGSYKCAFFTKCHGDTK